MADSRACSPHVIPVVLLALALPVLVLVGGSAHGASAGITLAAEPAYAEESAMLSIALMADEGPVADAAVIVERRSGGSWASVGTVTTDAAGRSVVAVRLHRDPGDNRVRATWVDASGATPVVAELTLPLLRRSAELELDGPRSFVDETRARLTATWRAGGEPVDGPVRLERRSGPKGEREWRRVTTKWTGADGVAAFEVSPRKDTVWRVKADALPWVRGARSARLKLRNLPPGIPLRLPRAAPRPRSLPPQPHASGAGPNARITRIPDAVWRQMVGRSWHRGCPVGRTGLRLLRINYWDYAGYRRRGELVAAAGAVGAMADALAQMYRRRLPIRSMYRVDRFGWSGRLGGADDYASMAAGNTSAFNCRQVVGRPGVRSPHAYGRSLDVNPWENPFTSRQGVYPNRWWLGRSHARVAWRSSAHVVVRLMARHGLRWTYGRSDLHHFDVVTRSGRVVLPRHCRVVVCG